jgi:hypothetical protein
VHFVARPQADQVIGDVRRLDVTDLRAAGRLERAGIPRQVPVVGRQGVGGQPALDGQVIEVPADSGGDRGQRSTFMVG